MEYFEYPEYADIMELFIETLTGTVFELRVSPFETVISVKAKIQRLEGIPISQQHLIWQSVELEDDYCLHDYGIPPSSSLKLVLAMRGGPINTRRIPMEDPAIREMAEYMEANRDEIWEKLPGNRQVTLLVFREGDQLNFFRVVDRGDGTLTPLSESLSGASMYNNMFDEEEEERLPTQEQSVENDVTMSKMKLLRAKMETLSIGKKKHKTPHPPTTARPKSTAVRRRLPVSKKKSPPLLNKNNPLPPVGTRSGEIRHSVDASVKLDSPKGSMDCSSVGGSASRVERRLGTADKRRSPAPPASCRALESLTSARLHRSYTNLGNMLPPSTATVMPEMRPNTSSKVQQVLTSSADARGRERSGIKAEARLVTELVNQANRDGKINDIVCGAPRDLHTAKGSGRTRAASGALALSQALNTTSSALKSTTNGDRIRTPDGRTALISAHSIRGRISGTRDGRLLSPSHRLPPVSSSKPTSLATTKKKTSKRCSFCNKKTGLATSYQCRCGHNFCATHRYAEAHHCGYDYKTEGRKMLEQSNPLVSAPKLPKI
ncbi:AN1-type zinc finger protein 4-like [Acanthaster planci]|uniref:AN1-type zinc finger protein 4-like n=1 Tax=Acanthaster planci TaxID=133434 RepID=A0A8B7ZYV5_ACAPL|nr:AN1-type zinc finger protein 4-like [Acanthaster planci]